MMAAVRSTAAIDMPSPADGCRGGAARMNIARTSRGTRSRAPAGGCACAPPFSGRWPGIICVIGGAGGTSRWYCSTTFFANALLHCAGMEGQYTSGLHATRGRCDAGEDPPPEARVLSRAL